MSLFQSFKDFLERRYPLASTTVVPDESISFSLNGFNYRFVYYTQEPSYFRLLLPRVAINETISVMQASQLACQISGRFKCGKIVIIQDAFWIAFEQIVPNTEMNNDDIFDLGIRVLEAMIREFKEGIDSFASHNVNTSQVEQ